MEKNEKQIIYEQRIYYVQDYINNHLDQELNLDRLAQISAFSSSHFHRIFKSVTGENLYEYIKRLRLEKSSILLTSNSNLKITNIALNCGFSTSSSFSKAFKKYYKISPTEYRIQNNKLNNNIGIHNSKNGTSNSKRGEDQINASEYISDKELEILYKRRIEMNVKVKKLPPYRIVYMRQIGPYGQENVHLMQKLKKWAITRNLLNESSIILGIAHDDPKVTPSDKCRYDTCFVLTDDYDLEDNMNEKVLPGGKYAMFPVDHTAEAISRAWHEIFSMWLPESGYQIDDRPIFEKYTGSTADIKIQPGVCEICVPIKSL